MDHRPRRLSVVIGIDHYRNFPANPLVGCVNDARAMEKLLRERFGFETFKFLLNDVATEAGITAALNGLVARTGRDDEVVVFYAGHGSWRQEGNKLVQTIVPHDSGRDDAENRDIPDAALFAFLRLVGTKTPYVTLIFDSCHAAGATRSDGRPWPASARSLPPDLRPDAEQRRPERPPLPDLAPHAERSTGYLGLLPPNERFTMLAACRADEAACEIRGVETPHGAFSFFLCQALEAIAEPISYRQLFEQVASAVTSRFPRQHPQIEGSWDRRLFGRDLLDSFRFVPVLERRPEGKVVLGAGATAGVVAGSEWRIFPRGLRLMSGEGERLGLVRVEEVGAVDALAAILEERGPIEALARAVEVSRPAEESRLAVRLGDPDLELASRVAESPLLRMASGENWDLAVERVDLAPGDFGPVFRDGTPLRQGPHWQIYLEPGEKACQPARPVAAGPWALVDDLEQWARYRQLLALENPHRDDRLHGMLELRLRRRVRYGGWQPVDHEDGGLARFEVGDRLAIDLTNHATLPLYVAVVGLGSGFIEIHHPARGGQHPLAPGETLTLGENAGENSVLELPEGVPRESHETIKVIATVDEVDFSVLRDHRVHRGGSPDPLERLLADTQAFRLMRKASTGGGWITCQRAFRLCRRMC